MRYITIPPAVRMPGQPADMPAYSIGSLVTEFALPDRRWKKEWAADFDAICAKLLDAKPGDVAALTDEEHEKVSPPIEAATIPPQLVRALMPLVHAITLAPREPPKGEP